LLRFYAFLHPDAIPEELITEGAPYLSPALQTLANDPLKLDEAIGELLNYSLVRRHPEMRSLPKFCPNWRQKYEARKSLSKREQ